MGHQYQHALRSRKDGDTQPIIESQRAWILQRNSRCSGVADTAVWSCLLDMTKQRVDVLTKLGAVGTETVPTAPSQTAPKSPVGPGLTTPSPNQGSPPTSPILKSDPSPNPASEGPNSLLLVLLVIGAGIGCLAIVGNIRRKKRLLEEERLAEERLAEERLAEERQRLAERQRLVVKYGEQAADLILARKVWQGMTDEQLIESWGSPDDKDSEIKRTTRKETWKYGQTGKNRFSNRVFLENGIVIGWKI
jgi:hypothetical protein